MPSPKILAKKQAFVKDIATLLKESNGTVVAGYRGLNVAQMTELRKELTEAGVEFHVLKNTLTRRATEEVDLTELNEHLVGPTAIAFSKEDPIAPAKVLHTFSKKYDALTLKAGVVEGRIVDEAQIKELADLPSREGLLSMLLSVLQAPMRNVALAVKAVADKEEAGAEAAAE